MTAARVARTAAIVPAAGRGERFGSGTPKALRLLAGVPLLVHVTRALSLSGRVDLVVVAAPRDHVEEVSELLGDDDDVRVVVVAGGDTRQRSVRLALASLPDEVTEVLVHDAARPLVPVDVIERVVTELQRGADAVVPAVAVADTIKQVREDHVVTTLDRSFLRAVQTPQGFRRAVLDEAHAAVGEAREMDATDDAALVERAGIRVVVVAGADEGFKVTRPVDLLLAEAVLAERKATSVS